MLFKRFFTSSFKANGLYKNYIQKISVGVSEISSKELNLKLSLDPVHGTPASLHILDVRETYEWNEDKIPYAIYTGRGNLERDIEGMVPNLDDEVILYCAGGFRSIIAADSLQKMYSDLFNISGATRTSNL